MHVHNSRAREPGSPCPGPSPIGSASRRQPTWRGTETRTRMGDRRHADLRRAAAARRARRPGRHAGAVPVAAKRMRSLNDRSQACPQKASTMTTICKRPGADDGAPVTGRAMAKHSRARRGPGGNRAPNAVGVVGGHERGAGAAGRLRRGRHWIVIIAWVIILGGLLGAGRVRRRVRQQLHGVGQRLRDRPEPAEQHVPAAGRVRRARSCSAPRAARSRPADGRQSVDQQRREAAGRDQGGQPVRLV